MAWQNLPSTSTPLNATNLNSLDNSIESGTWTPELTTVEGATPTITYTTRYGKYRKIGDLIFVEFYIRGKITALTGTNNFGAISGLPYTASYTTAGDSPCSLGVLYGVSDSQTDGKANFMGSLIRLYGNNGATSMALKITTTSYMEIGGSGWYIKTS